MKEKIKSDLKTAMFAKDELRISTLRLLLSALKNYEIEKGLGYEATDEDILTIISREIKKRKESIEFYKKGERLEMAEKEEKELNILISYQPKQMSEEEIREIIKGAKETTNAINQSDMGKLMGVVMPQVKGKADGGLVSRIVREELS